MDELFTNLSSLNSLQWDNGTKSLDADSFQATDIWFDAATQRTHAGTKDVKVSALDEWLLQKSQGAGSGSLRLVARFAWILADDKEKTINVPYEVMNRLNESFGLALAYKYSVSYINGAAALPRRVSQDTESQAYSFCYLPKLAALWSHTKSKAPSSAVTTGLILATKDYQKPLQKTLDKTWSFAMTSHAMFLAMCINISFGKQIDKSHELIKDSLRKIEDRTGYHAFQRKGVPDHAEDLGLQEELGRLSRDSNGSATKLASLSRKANMTGKLLEFITRNVEDEEMRLGLQAAGPGQASQDGPSLLRGHVSVLQDRLAMQELDMEYTKSRVNIQINAVS
jgi:hypothetical protein